MGLSFFVSENFFPFRKLAGSNGKWDWQPTACTGSRVPLGSVPGTPGRRRGADSGGKPGRRDSAVAGELGRCWAAAGRDPWPGRGRRGSTGQTHDRRMAFETKHRGGLVRICFLAFHLFVGEVW